MQKDVNFKTVDISEPEKKNRLDWRFDEFNPIRAARGAPAARVFVDQNDGQGETWLWMHKIDVQNNIKDFGDHPELQKALRACEAFGEC